MKTHVITRAFITLLLLTSSYLVAYSRHSFVENIGQVKDQSNNTRPDILAKYTAGNSLNIFLAKTAVHYQFSIGDALYRMDVNLIGANPNARLIKEKSAAFKEQYHLGNLKGVASTFEKIIYKDIYPDIDWVFYFNNAGKLEHDFVVKPGGKVSDIKLEYLGANSLKIDHNGNLVATTSYGTITEPKPYSYDQTAGKTISSSYVLNGNILTFETGKYNNKSTLIIDPVIDWSTYLGGSEYDDIRDTKIGKDGFVYVVGSTNSTSNIATLGAHLTSFQGGNNSSGADVFISKFSSDGNCVWSTYYGGPSTDIGLSLAFDTAGYLFVVGRTNSTTGIATLGCHQETKAGNLSSYDAFLLKMDTTGTPVWSTYFGGPGSEGTQALGMCSDKNGNIYISGNTNSPSGIATQGSFQAIKSGGEDGFIAKFNNQGILQWSTYYGSTLADNINNMTTDGSGNLIVVGHTQSTSGLSTANAHLEIGNGNIDGFLAKFDSNGQRLWATYYGGSGNDLLYSVTTDSTDAIYCSGMTDSDSDISTIGAHQTVIGGNTEYDACIVKFNPNGSLNWSTYYGGVEGERSYSILFSDNKLFFTGNSSSSSNITTLDGIKPVFNNSASEGVLATFSSTGQRLWATYLGGDAVEVIRAVALDDSGNVFLGGETLSPVGLSTNGAHQTTFGGNRDGWLIKIKMCDLPQAPTQILGNNEVCENSPQQYTVPPVSGAISYSWILPIGWTGASTSQSINIIVGSTSGEIKVVALNTCGKSDTISLEVTVNPAPHPNIDRNGSILSVTQTFNSYQWLLNSNPINGATGMTHVALENGIYTLQVQDDNGCEGLSNEIVIGDMVSVDKLLKENGIHLYPNPFITKAYVETDRSLNIVVVDISGREVLTKYGIKTNTMLDLHVLPIGNFYFKMFDHKTNKYLGTAFMVKTDQ